MIPYTINLGNIGSGNAMLPDGTKPSSAQLLANHQWSLVAFTWGQFQVKCQRHLSWVWKYKISANFVSPQCYIIPHIPVRQITTTSYSCNIFFTFLLGTSWVEMDVFDLRETSDYSSSLHKYRELCIAHSEFYNTDHISPKYQWKTLYSSPVGCPLWIRS